MSVVAALHSNAKQPAKRIINADVARSTYRVVYHDSGVGAMLAHLS